MRPVVTLTVDDHLADAVETVRAVLQPGAGSAAALQPAADSAAALLPAGPAAWRARLESAVQPGRPVPDDVDLVLPTSGSTAAPTGVLITAAAWRWAASAVLARLGGPGSWLLALPLTHVAGVMVVARAGVSGSDVVAVDLEHGFRADAFARAVDALPPGRAYTSLVPIQLRRLLEHDPAPLRRFDAVLVGGAAAPAGLLDQAAQHGVRVVRSYGMTETCGGCVLDGVPLDGVTVTLQQSGRICLDGPMLASARRTATADEPLPRPLPTPDTGRWRQGLLHVLGRLDDVVLSGGVSVPLSRVDELLCEHPGLAEAAAVGVDDPDWGTRVVAVAVPRDAACPPTAADVRRFVHERAEPAFVPVEVVLVDALPRPAPGKLDRAALRALVVERRR
jgi:O-succinylbenzoic acid--CoA ligase